MFNLEGELPRRSFVIDLLKVTGGLVAAATSAPIWLPPRVARAEEWLGVADEPWQYPDWNPLSPEVAQAKRMHTVYEQGGPLDIYDLHSPLVGEQTNFRQKGEDLAEWYFKTFSFLDPILLNTTGFCHGGVNASAYGEPKPMGDDPIPLFAKSGIMAAYHSGDSMYKPGLEQLMEDLATQGRPFVIEIQGPDGLWGMIAFRVNARRTLLETTDFGRAPKTRRIDQVQNAYFPVPQGEEGNYPSGTVYPAIDSPEILEKFTFNLNRQLVHYLNYNQPLG